MTNAPVKVFISYSHDSQTLLDAVLQLANKLRSEGIDASIDQYVQSPSEGWPRWMESQIEIAEFVLIVATQAYKEKPKSEDVNHGRGVTWEISLIYQHLYNKVNPAKFIPIVFESPNRKYIPAPLQGQTSYNILDPKEYDDLYWRLRGINTREKPPLGEQRPLEQKERKSAFLSTFIDIELWNKANWNGTVFMHDQEFKHPPILALRFTDKEAAEQIFKQWITRLSVKDEFDELRISIIDGPLPSGQTGYTVHVGSNLENIINRYKRDGIEVPMDYFIHISRFNRMNPNPTSTNLEVFLKRYRQFGCYFLAAAYGEGGSVTLHENSKIMKKQLIYRDVKDVPSKDDWDSIIFLPENQASP